jgi:hypothetical protein
VDLGGGLYGETDRTLNLTIGPSKIASVDDATHQMTATIDGQVVRTIPVSMGRDESIVVDGNEISFVTPSGIYVAQEKYEVKQMSSSTYGLPTTYDLGYDSAIPLAVRLSNSGIFAHSAPWSVADQGVRRRAMVLRHLQLRRHRHRHRHQHPTRPRRRLRRLEHPLGPMAQRQRPDLTAGGSQVGAANRLG